MLLDLCPIWPDLSWLLPGALLYAEMHYRWWPLPLLLLVKDAHRYPITLERATVEVDTPDGGWVLCVEQDEPFDPLNIRRIMLDL